MYKSLVCLARCTKMRPLESVADTLTTTAKMACSTLMEDLPPGGPLNIVLLGKTGHGKSTTGNSIFNRKIFYSLRSSESVTHKCQLESAIVGGRMINLVDTPGTMDTNNPDATLKEIGTAIAYRTEGFHAFLMVFNPDTRMTDEEWRSITLLKKLFGKDVLKDYTILVFTHGDSFKEDEDMHGKTILEYLQCQGPNVIRLVGECNKRCFIINNREKDPIAMRKEVIELISMVDRLVKENSGKMYTNDLFKIVQDALTKEEEAIKRKEEEIKKQEEEEKEKDAENNRKKEEELDRLRIQLYDRKNNKYEYAGGVMASYAISSGRGCFPHDALVKLEDGKIIVMADLQVGHKVLSSVSNTKLEYSEVYFFAHLDPWNQSQYICICASKYKLKLTPDHHIFIVGNRNTLDTVPAEKINIGDRILIFDEATSSIQEEIVTNLSKSTEVGIYAPITMSGSIIVDNVLVSCYVDTVPPKISHSLLWPMRKLYQCSPSLSTWVNKARKEGIPIWVQWIIVIFLRWQK